MRRAPKACTDPDCPNTQPCPEHQRKPWAGNEGRHGRMRSGSREQRINRGVMEMHDGICHVCGQYGADEVDHVIPLAQAARLPEHRHLPMSAVETVDNRKPVHSSCHTAKTHEESQRARAGV